MTQSFEENINDNFEAAKSAIANCAPIALVQTVNGKQDALSSTQISNIAKGGTALQPSDVDSELSTTSTNPVQNKVITTELNKKIEGISSSDVTTALGYTPYNATNPNGYTSNVGTITGIKMNGSSKGTSGVVDLGTVITAHQDISGKQDKITTTNKLSADLLSEGTTNKLVSATEKSTWNGKQNAITSTSKLSADLISDGTTNKTVTATEKSTWNNKLDSSAISDMATKTWVGQQGYTSNVGTVTKVNNTSPDSNGNVTISIPSAVTESTVSGWGFTKNEGTITGIKMNGASKGTSGVVNLGTVLTAHQDISGKVNVSDIASSVSASSTNAVPVGAKLFYDTVGNIETALNTINSGSNS